MNLYEEQFWHVVQGIIGKEVSYIGRVFSVRNKEIDISKGELQIEFSDNSVIFLKHGHAGQTPEAIEKRWVDPLAGKLDPETQRWVSEVGKDELIDVSDEFLYQTFIHKNIRTVQPIFYALSNVKTIWLCGVRFINEANDYLNFYYAGDESYVVGGDELPEWLIVRNEPY